MQALGALKGPALSHTMSQWSSGRRGHVTS